MDNRFKILSAGLITGAVFIIFLYSPIGSPDLYRNTSLYKLDTKPGVNFEGRSGYTPSRRSGRSTYQPSSGVDASVGMPDRPTYSISGGTGTPESFKPNTGGGLGTVYSTIRSNTTPTNGGLFLLAGGTSRAASGRSSANDFGGKGHGFIALNSEVSTVGSTPTTRQLATNDTPLGGPDPGGDPVDPAIPVSNGLYFMLLLALGYFVKKL